MTRERRVRGLAVFGGEPAFSEALHVGRPNIGDREHLHRRIDEMLDRRWLTNDGPFLQEMETRITEMLGVRHCVATCNATIGLQLVAQALGLEGEVILPSFTFVATAHALRWIGLEPVFCDVDPRTHTLDPACAARLITDRTSAILGVHTWGNACDTDRLEQLAAEQHLAIFYDAAHAFTCSRDDRMIGGFGSAEVFSFHATKFVNAFEGGAITTNDDELAERLRLARNFGFETFDRVVALGTNAKMSEASAAMALTSFESIGTFVASNRANYQAYQARLGEIEGVNLIEPQNPGGNSQYVVAEVDSARCGLTRDRLLEVLHAENILARRYFFPGCHRMEPYCREEQRASTRLLVTEAVADRVLVLPTGTAISPEHVDVICGVIELAVQSAVRLAGEQ